MQQQLLGLLEQDLSILLKYSSIITQYSVGLGTVQYRSFKLYIINGWCMLKRTVIILKTALLIITNLISRSTIILYG